MLEKRTHLWVLLHTLAIACVLVSLSTGLRIASLSHPQIAAFSALLPQGNVHLPHFISAVVLAAVAAVYLFLNLLGKRRGKVRSTSLLTRYHTWITRLGYCLVLTAIVTGTCLIFDRPFQSRVALLHLMAALGMLAYLLLHGGVYFLQHGLRMFLHILKPVIRRPYPLYIAALTITASALAIYIFQIHSRYLPVTAIDLEHFIEIDGHDSEPFWQRAREIQVHTYGGANFINGATEVSLKALHNGEEIFFYIVWQDATESRTHLPLKKTAQGWQVMQSGFSRYDETKFYEDKFAIMLSTSCEYAAAGTSHLGPQPLKNKPQNWHGRGYHYATDGRVRDLWHWKAVRSNGMHLMDDNYIGAPESVRPAQRRYTAGYQTDAKESGAYVMNWQWYSPEGVVPKRLPSKSTTTPPYKTSPSRVIPWFDYEPYQAANDTYAVGTVLPSVMYNSNRFEGDRADVRARGIWLNGYWHLEVVRKLNTNSEKDLAITSNVCLWVSAFDHSQTAHTRHQQPLKIRLL